MYVEHLKKNWKVSLSGIKETFRNSLKGNFKLAGIFLLLSTLHFLHGLFPFAWTSHETWGIHL